MGEDCVAAPYLRALDGAALVQPSVKDLDVPAADAKRRAVALEHRSVPRRPILRLVAAHRLYAMPNPHCCGLRCALRLLDGVMT
ncbi:MAG: hypothetical protein U0269_19780 [Polyangiales bacterium]